MGTPYTPPGTDPTGYPGPQPSRPIPTTNEIPAELPDDDRDLTRPQKDDL